jgi:NAD(P)-dependent dehydrogenase (short-subunit alcohol dehydrogenase family)
MRLRDKVAIVTGGASVIGQATAVRFAQEGAKVVVADIDEAQGNRTVAMIAQNGGKALFVGADVSDERDAERITQSAMLSFSRLDILVNDAAVFVLKGFSDTREEWMRSLSVNVLGTTCARGMRPLQ